MDTFPLRRDGEIGIHEGLKILWTVMSVRVRPPFSVQQVNANIQR